MSPIYRAMVPELNGGNVQAHKLYVEWIPRVGLNGTGKIFDFREVTKMLDTKVTEK